ncbi:extracellular catalytic domain type 1 short-chain-length polyhydroxyalkanoate depolymerase [Sphingomonas japonica]|uniref:Poly(Hydroxyalkanoate) depolymerase family esterase n=1 Tax=Sphingomonas japonica TaxID=511662 RepID=A0ABX0TY95_9SPHN|nr:PHB depolymerase family esterase [Sphingomonas japonica]NIJ23288.1 poly(hydroxyalkanoate) depolymerase family esterase [Sphingomonas japonica]
MKFALPSKLDTALALVRSGDLAAATAAIQASLGSPAARPTRAAAGETALPRIGGRPQGNFAPARYAGPEGTLDYHLYRPSTAAAGMPLLVMLHGCTQDPEDFARGTGMNAVAEQLGMLVAYPRQPQSANAQKCWNWFRPGDQNRGGGEPALIAAATRAILAEADGDAARVYVAGLSAGGAAAAILAAAYPELFAAVGVHSGLACGAARDLPSALAAMRSGARAAPSGDARFVPVITFHGDRDTTVNAANAQAIVAQATALHPAPLATTVEDLGGHVRATSTDRAGRIVIEQWTVRGGGHAWSGGSRTGSYADPGGPDASREMARFFLTHRLAG